MDHFLSEELNLACQAIFAERERTLEQRRQVARRRPANFGSLDESSPERLGRKGKRRMWQNYLPQPGEEYIRRLRSRLEHIFPRFCDPLCLQALWQAEYASIWRAVLHLLYCEQKFGLVHFAIDSLDFLSQMPRRWALEIQEIWDSASYHLDGKKAVQDLTSVNRYRIRKSRICPLRMLYGDIRYSFDKISREYLGKQYVANPRPSTEEKIQMSKEIGLPLRKISNWFKNRRQRRRLDSSSSDQRQTSSTSTPSLLSTSSVCLSQMPDTQCSLENPQTLVYLLTPNAQQLSLEEPQQQDLTQFHQEQLLVNPDNYYQPECYLDPQPTPQPAIKFEQHTISCDQMMEEEVKMEDTYYQQANFAAGLVRQSPLPQEVFQTYNGDSSSRMYHHHLPTPNYDHSNWALSQSFETKYPCRSSLEDLLANEFYDLEQGGICTVPDQGQYLTMNY